MAKEQSELIGKLRSVEEKVVVGERYHNYKNPDKTYMVLNLAFIESTEELAVVYQAEYGEKLTWIRSVTNFLEKVTLPDGIQVDRFTKVG